MQLATHHPGEAHAPKPFYRQLYFQVLTAIVLGVTVGHFWPEIGASLKPLGDAFVKLVKMIIAPVIFLTVATGIAGMSDLKKVGRVAGKAMLYFITFSTLALIVGLIVGNFVQPGAGLGRGADGALKPRVSCYDRRAAWPGLRCRDASGGSGMVGPHWREGEGSGRPGERVGERPCLSTC